MTEERTINKLPKDWKWVKLGDVCQKVEAVKRKEKNPEEELLYLDIGGIDNASYKILNHKNYKWKDAPSRAQQIVLKDDILFSTVRTYMKNIAVVEDKIYDGQIASSGFCVIRSDKKITNPKFIFYYTVSEKFLRPLNELQTGSSYPAVRDKDVFSQPFPLPSKEVQGVLVSKIEELFSEIDKGIEEIKTAQQQLKVYRQAVLKSAFEGKLTNEDVKEGELPEGWVLKQVNDLKYGEAGAIGAGPFGTIFKAKDFRSSGIPIIFLRHVKAGVYNTRKPGFMDKKVWEELFQEYSVFGGELLITKLGEPPGECAIFPDGVGPAMVTPDVIKMKVDLELIEPKYLMYYFNSENSKKALEKIAFGTTRLRITLPIFKALPIPYCAKEEQQQIVQEIESRLSVCDKMEETITNSLKRAEALRQSILKKAFEGKLV